MIEIGDLTPFYSGVCELLKAEIIKGNTRCRTSDFSKATWVQISLNVILFFRIITKQNSFAHLFSGFIGIFMLEKTFISKLMTER